MIKLARLLSFIAALTFGLQPAIAGMLINPFVFAVAAVNPSITFLQCSTVNTTPQTTYTFTTQNTGTASADRYTLYGIMAQDGTSIYNVASTDVGGDAATILVDYGAVGGNPEAALAMVLNTAGTSETITVTWSEPINMTRLCIWQVNNIASATPVSTASARAISGATVGVSLNVSALGIAAYACAASTLTASPYSVTGMTERDDFAGATGELDTTAGDFTNDAVADTPLSTVITNSGGNNSCVSASLL